MSAARDISDTAEHLFDHYGRCVAQPCTCMRAQWLGRKCPNWRPGGATTQAELMARARKLHEERRT